MSDQVIKKVESVAFGEGVHDLRTYSKGNGELILDADLLSGMDPDELWDKNYDPEIGINPPNFQLRNEHISDEEVEDLILDAAEEIVLGKYEIVP